MAGDGLEPAPRERGWLRLFLALAAFLLLPRTMPFRAVAPVEETVLLLAPALAVCFLVGLSAGGRVALALLWAGAAALVLYQARPAAATAGAAGGAGGPYLDLARAWGLLAAGAFGVVCVFGAVRSFLAKALSGIGLALLLGLVLVALGEAEPGRARDVFAAQFEVRFQQWTQQVQQLATLGPGLGAVVERTSQDLQRIATLAAPLYPALLALESLAAFALAWALYHRLTRARIGAPLAPLKQFRFSDLLVWGPVVGLTLVLLPTLATFEAVGSNLLVFFAALYALRGLGVAAWFLLQSSTLVTLSTLGVALVFGPVTALLAMGLGLTDTWLDWRRRPRAAA